MIWLLLYILAIVAANWTLATFGAVPVWPGILAPAGVYFAGAVFTFRDMTQMKLGKRWAIGAIFVGAAFSAITSQRFALASLAAFLLGEFLDFAVFSRLRQQGRLIEAFALGNTLGLLADSVLFLTLAFGSLDYLLGQAIGKSWVTAVTVAILWFIPGYRNARRAAGTDGVAEALARGIEGAQATLGSPAANVEEL